MLRRVLPHTLLVATLLAGLLAVEPARAVSQPTVSQALALEPLQPGVDYDKPTSEQAADCTIKSQVQNGVSGWIVLGEGGQTLRRFLDSNRDNKVDLWCYFKDGLEVYRDIDVDFNGKADQYRWLATAGTRWGLDPDEDGKIDSWKMISPEEVTAEVVAAIREQDVSRFQRLLPSTDELEQLGLGKAQRADLGERVQAAKTGFAEWAAGQSVVNADTQWLQFGASRPGILVAGSEGSTKDLMIYDNVAAIIEKDGKHGQLAVGTLVQIGSGWRVIDLPSSDAAEGFFYAAITRSQPTETPVSTGLDKQMQDLLAELETVDKSLVATAASDRGELHAKRASLLEKLVENAQSDTDRGNWIRQYADMLSAAVQAGEYPKGIERLKTVLDGLATDSQAATLLPYVEFRYMTADYGQKLQKPNADFAKVQEQWLKDLEAFIKSHPKADETAEAMLQLAIALEFAGKEQDAINWYARIVKDFPQATIAAKAAGAQRRLESVGKSIELRGKSLTGAAVDLARFRGKVVLIHYWATWCEPCKRDMQTLKALQAKFARKGFTLIGVNLDSDARGLDEYVRSERLSWPQLHEPGGLDSRLANELGILTLPTMLLVDKTGRVVRRNVHVGELEAEIAKLAK